MKEPLSHFLSNKDLISKPIERISHGEKYVGVLLKNGQIGVCSTLGQPIVPEQLNFDNPNLKSPSFRIFFNAYINAVVNYQITPEEKLDIFQHIDFTQLKNIVMVGFFRPLVRKFQEDNIPLVIFDRVEQDELLTPYDQMLHHLSDATTVILTSTSIFNETFSDVIRQTSETCDVFLLGPSSILHPDMKRYRNVKKIYGALFEPYDHRILDIIDQGHGTRTFLKFGRKVNI